MKTVLAFCALTSVLLLVGTVRSAAVDLDAIALPDGSRSTVDNKNVIEVPVNCKEGERPDANGRCRPIFSRALDLKKNLAILKAMSELLHCDENPTHPGCIKLQGSIQPSAVIEVPTNCPAGSRPDANGRCRPIARSLAVSDREISE